MRLYEFAGDDSAAQLKLVSILKQIEGRIKDTDSSKGFSLNSILSKLKASGLNFTEEDFREMSKSEPISNMVSNIKGDQVIFKGVEQETEQPDEEEADKTVEKMAKKASKKPQF